MIYKQTNKTGNSTFIVRLEDVSYVKSKLVNAQFQVIVGLKSGDKLPLNMSRPQCEEFIESFEEKGGEAKQYKKRMEQEQKQAEKED